MGCRLVERILVVGVTGAGKSTLARVLSGRLGLPYHEMDGLYFTGPDWAGSSTPWAVRRFVICCRPGRPAPGTRAVAWRSSAVPKILASRLPTPSASGARTRSRPGRHPADPGHSVCVPLDRCRSGRYRCLRHVYFIGQSRIVLRFWHGTDEGVRRRPSGRPRDGPVLASRLRGDLPAGPARRTVDRKRQLLRRLRLEGAALPPGPGPLLRSPGGRPRGDPRARDRDPARGATGPRRHDRGGSGGPLPGLPRGQHGH